MTRRGVEPAAKSGRERAVGRPAKQGRIIAEVLLSGFLLTTSLLKLFVAIHLHHHSTGGGSGNMTGRTASCFFVPNLKFRRFIDS